MAKQMEDIGLDAAEDLHILSGDFAVTENTPCHQQQLLLNNKGDFKERPTVCVGVFSYIDDENYRGLIRAVNIEFTRDGMEVGSIDIQADGTVVSDAVYK